MEKISIDGNVSSRDELHNMLKEKLGLPEYYGKNLDALWDCLTGYIQLPLTIEWFNYDITKKNLGSYAEKLLSLMREAEKELDGFKFELR